MAEKKKDQHTAEVIIVAGLALFLLWLWLANKKNAGAPGLQFLPLFGQGATSPGLNGPGGLSLPNQTGGLTGHGGQGNGPVNINYSPGGLPSGCGGCQATPPQQFSSTSQLVSFLTAPDNPYQPPNLVKAAISLAYGQPTANTTPPPPAGTVSGGTASGISGPVNQFGVPLSAFSAANLNLVGAPSQQDLTNAAALNGTYVPSPNSGGQNANQNQLLGVAAHV